MEEAPVNAIVRRADDLLAAYDARKDKGGGHLPENPYEVLRECKEWLEQFCNMLASECQENAKIRKALARIRNADFVGHDAMALKLIAREALNQEPKP